MVEERRGLELVDQCLRHGRTRLVVASIVAQDDGVRHPVLVELRGHLYEVTWRLCTRDALVALGSEEAVQGMPELVEERLDIVRRQEGWCTGSGSGEVTDVVDDRLTTKEEALLDEVLHPCPTILGRTAEVVGIEEGERGAIPIDYLIDLHPISIDGDIGAGLEAEAVELISGEENPVLQYAVEYEVGLEVILVEVKLLLLQSLSIVVPVPSLELEVLPLRLLCKGRQLGGISLHLLAVGRSDPLDEAIDGGWLTCHLVTEHPGCEGGVAEELGLVGS